MALLKRMVRGGLRNSARSLRMIGLILKMSLALFGLMFFIVLATISVVVWLSLKDGGGLSSSSFSSSSWGRGGVVWGMVSLVLCPMVMNRSLRASAMSVGSVYVMFSYMIVVGMCGVVIATG